MFENSQQHLNPHPFNHQIIFPPSIHPLHLPTLHVFSNYDFSIRLPLSLFSNLNIGYFVFETEGSFNKQGKSCNYIIDWSVDMVISELWSIRWMINIYESGWWESHLRCTSAWPKSPAPSSHTTSYSPSPWLPTTRSPNSTSSRQQKSPPSKSWNERSCPK